MIQETLHGAQLLFHNAKFDLAVMTERMGCPMPPTESIHDTMLQAFLLAPYDTTLGLKALAEKYLGWKPEERDAVVDWVTEHLRRPDGKPYTDAPKSDNYAGAMVAYVPAAVAGPYACGDVDRTYELFIRFREVIKQQGMEAAYNRERRVIPILIENEKRGMRVDLPRMEAVVERADRVIDNLGAFMSDRLGPINFDSDKQLIPALAGFGVLDTSKLLKTAKGQDSLSKASMEAALDPQWREMITYYRNLHTCCNNFMIPWILQARETSGIIHTSWNQVAQVRQGAGVGARTGRFSSTPSFMNIPKIGGASAPAGLAEWLGFPVEPVPYVRSFVVPWEPDWILIDRDYSQQEVRILAHMAGNFLKAEYLKNPWMDLHTLVQTLMKAKFEVELPRKQIKGLNFMSIYGGGVKRAAAVLDVDENRAKIILDALHGVNPDLPALSAVCNHRAKAGEPIRTWGGRQYQAPVDTKTGKKQAYKLVNYAIQGSAADNIKEAWLALGLDTPAFKTYMTVHDEFVASVPRSSLHSGHKRLKDAMEGVSFDVPMLSEGTWSDTNWAEMKPYDEKGRMVYENKM